MSLSFARCLLDNFLFGLDMFDSPLMGSRYLKIKFLYLKLMKRLYGEKEIVIRYVILCTL